MATFVFNKLIRDKLRFEYEKLHQKATYRKLSNDELAGALKQKLIEEIKEIELSDRESVITELADVYQVVEEFLRIYDINPEEIRKVKAAKFEKKGGFSEGLFVETLQLTDDDEWNEYYRKQPDVFKEVSDK
ncbi:MAG: nucleoside triphosphate pyrophosphohydrolase [Patescibacteria group bacterium]